MSHHYPESPVNCRYDIQSPIAPPVLSRCLIDIANLPPSELWDAGRLGFVPPKATMVRLFCCVNPPLPRAALHLL